MQVVPVVLNVRVLPLLFEVSMVLHEVKWDRSVVDWFVTVVEEACIM